jgi:UDP-N-acetyl-alpha-D-quinovosamine dehydrogenase
VIALVTGASGFVGTRLCARLVEDGQFRVRASSRRAYSPPAGVEPCHVADVGPDTDWNTALAGVSVVVHLAARVHVMREASASPLEEFRRVNVAGTERLLRQALASGVRRFVYVSSVKVNGESGSYSETDPPRPESPYAISKYEAERVVHTFADRMETVIVRPPLVYGPGVRANFQALLRTVRRGLPLPFGSIRNRRSLVALDNLVDFILTCMVHPAAPGETFLVSDGDDLSTPDLIRRIARAFDRSPHLLPIPEPLLFAAAAAVGRRSAAQKVLGSLRVDISKAGRVLGWVPPYSVDEELRRIAESA